MFGFLYGVSHVYAACVSTNQNYCLLAPLPGLGTSVDTTKGVGDYLNTIIRVIIGFMAVLAVVMMVVGGIQYMVSNIAGEKASAKSRMTNAIFGLVLALSSYMILNTINPNLVNLKIGITSTSIQNFDNTAQGQDGNPNVGKQAAPGVKGNVLVLAKNVDNNYPDGLQLNSNDMSSLKLETVSVYSAFDNTLKSNSIFGPAYDSHNQNIQISSYIETRLKKALLKWRDTVNNARDLAPGVRQESQNEDVNYLITYLSGYAPSQSEGNNTYQSSHAFGVSFDIQPSPIPSDLRTIFQDNGFAVGETTNKQTNEKYTHVTRLKDDGGMSGYSFTIDSFFTYQGE